MPEKKIASSDIEQVARLVRLGLSAEEKEKFGRQLNDILLYIEKLNELDLEAVEPLVHILPRQNILREDRVQSGLDQEEALASAPDQQAGFFKVPPVIE